MKNKILYLLICLSSISFAQESISELLEKYNNHSVPYISVQELAMPKTEAILLDARDYKEYAVSHIKNAIHVGYDNFDLKTLKKNIPETSTTIVVYCTIGVRSEHIAEQLKQYGYTNVYNLFGGIFEWKNNDFPIYNSDNKETEKVHVHSKDWAKWLLKGIKIYD